MFDPDDPVDRGRFLNFAVMFEGGLLLVAFALGWLVAVNPVEQLDFDVKAVSLGGAAALPVFAVFLVSWRMPVAQFVQIRNHLISVLGPWLAACRHIDLILLAVLAGVCEELLFRGVLQPWLAQYGELTGLIISNILFGLAHAITLLYAVSAGAIGLYLGCLPKLGDAPNLLIPVTTHAVYDYFAFLVVVRTFRNQCKAGPMAEQP